jgi:hypothetical protein
MELAKSKSVILRLWFIGSNFKIKAGMNGKSIIPARNLSATAITATGTTRAYALVATITDAFVLLILFDVCFHDECFLMIV